MLREEMRQVLVFLEWKSNWWLQRQSLREGVARELGEGLMGYALEQADVQRHLTSHFQEIWHGSLNNPDGDNNDGDDDDDNDDNAHECEEEEVEYN